MVRVGGKANGAKYREENLMVLAKDLRLRQRFNSRHVNNPSQGYSGMV